MTRTIVHVLGFVMVTALILTGGIILISHLTIGAGFGIAVLGAGLWGFSIGAIAMAYYEARIMRRAAPAPDTLASTEAEDGSRLTLTIPCGSLSPDETARYLEAWRRARSTPYES